MELIAKQVCVLPHRLNCYISCLALVLTGCLEKRVVWSPDGKIAAVISDEGLFLCDDQGALSPLLVEHVSAASWLPASKELILVQHEDLQEWSSVEKQLTRSSRDQIRAWATQVMGSLRGGVAWEEAFATLKKQHQLEDNEVKGVQLCLRDTRAEDLKAIDKVPHDALNKLDVTVVSVRRAAADHPRLKLGPTLAGGFLRPIQQPRPSPDGRFVAFVAGQDRTELYVAPSGDAATPLRVDERQTSFYPDWTSDSRSLLYVRAMGQPGQEDELTLGILTRRQVQDEQGTLSRAPKTEDLAGLLFDPMARVRCFKDGRIMFSSTELCLPVTEKDAPRRQQLFVLDPARQATIGRLIPNSASGGLPDSLNVFEVSPDEKHLAVADDKGRVSLFTIATAEVTKVQPNEGGSLKTIPDWKFPDELCFVNVPEAGSAKELEVAIRSASGTIRLLSENWPAEARKGLLEK
ncbi:MAG: hypothetical protein HY735_12720 [Verrucomicrobia bacterium]|nr:hypothetical protein [Verrucomicrobiota bacterium]